MRDVLLFDLNETLLDLGALDPIFARIFGDAAVRKTWFAQVRQLFMTATIIDHYRSFDLLVEDALTMVASSRACSLTAADRVDGRGVQANARPVTRPESWGTSWTPWDFARSDRRKIPDRHLGRGCFRRSAACQISLASHGVHDRAASIRGDEMRGGTDRAPGECYLLALAKTNHSAQCR